MPAWFDDWRCHVHTRLSTQSVGMIRRDDFTNFSKLAAPIARQRAIPAMNALLISLVLSTLGAPQATSVGLKDFGAIGDGKTHKVTADQLKRKTALGVSGAHRLDDFDAEDTVDWLAFHMASRRLAAQGGGVLHIPNGHYIIRRPLVLMSTVRVVGESRDGVIFENNYDRGGSVWQTEFRRYGFFAGNHHPVIFNESSKSAVPHYDVKGAIAAGQTEVPMAAPAKATEFTAGDFVFIRHTSTYPSGHGEAVVPYWCYPNRVIEIDARRGVLKLEYPVKGPLAAGEAKVARMGAGRDGTMGGAPWTMVHDCGIENVLFRARTLSQRNGWYRGWLRNIRAETASEGIVSNCLYRCVFEDVELRVGRTRAIECKGCSHESVYRRWRVQQAATAPVDEPMISIGESSEDITLEDCVFVENEHAAGDKIIVNTADRIVFDRVRYTASTSGTILNAGTHPGHPLHLVIRNSEFVARGDRVSRFARLQCDVVEIDGLTCSGKVAARGNQVSVEKVVAGSIANLKFSEPSYRLGGASLKNIKVLKSARPEGSKN
ncbi:MAG: hypothetical protein ACOY3P_09680 [Planctomycetota bacterium]